MIGYIGMVKSYVIRAEAYQVFLPFSVWMVIVRRMLVDATDANDARTPSGTLVSENANIKKLKQKFTDVFASSEMADEKELINRLNVSVDILTNLILDCTKLLNATVFIFL